MDSNIEPPRITHCPKCDTKLKKLVYGMLAGPPADDEIAGGCSIALDSPSKICPKCEWTCL